MSILREVRLLAEWDQVHEATNFDHYRILPPIGAYASDFTQTTLVTSTTIRTSSSHRGDGVTYHFRGHFIEACDCFELCPCWVDDSPDEGHCTGLVVWEIEEGTIDGEPVDGRAVAAVTSHGPARRDSRATTVLFIDDGAENTQYTAIDKAFRGDLVPDRQDPLGVLMSVTGTVLETVTAPIAVRTTSGGWSIRIGDVDCPLVSAHGVALSFEGETEPLEMNHTALHRELRIVGSSTAQRGEELRIAVPALRGGGYIEAAARSGMRGGFEYRY
ncbi:DUF1326 domain-containing protein [Actinomycetospora chibensis]|uniref:DUF1326 domain-containing protein n=1 Tax=Actinomycetospora chibensis TaxID=663606 RepID=A0ABV9RKL0_9PSEU|nr:DUF1326 domain-containing protein [Actinomycetospora chibensis]MDD7926124.1 DUF1326 domain-containing protein [Actinomycetospora chibensis]